MNRSVVTGMKRLINDSKMLIKDLEVQNKYEKVRFLAVLLRYLSLNLFLLGKFIIQQSLV
jgi:hypothetical protein